LVTVEPSMMIFRLPVVTPMLNKEEAAMTEMLQLLELEESMLNDHEIRHKWVRPIFLIKLWCVVTTVLCNLFKNNIFS
jgi:hypothetical protein